MACFALCHFQLFFSLKMGIKFKSRGWLVGIMVFNATFNNISAISWWSVLLVEETGVPGENHRPVASGRSWRTKEHVRRNDHVYLNYINHYGVCDIQNFWNKRLFLVYLYCKFMMKKNSNLHIQITDIIFIIKKKITQLT